MTSAFDCFIFSLPFRGKSGNIKRQTAPMCDDICESVLPCLVLPSRGRAFTKSPWQYAPVDMGLAEPKGFFGYNYQLTSRAVCHILNTKERRRITRGFLTSMLRHVVVVPGVLSFFVHGQQDFSSFVSGFISAEKYFSP